MKGFRYDGPIMSFLSRMADLLFLNILVLVFCLPIFTIGATITAAHYTALKLCRLEGNVWNCFWKSFKINLKQSTLIWLIFLMQFIFSVLAYVIAGQMRGEITIIIRGVIIIAVVISVFLGVWVMPLQARFVNPIIVTFKNSFYIAFQYFFRTLLMIVFYIMPIVTLLLGFEFTGMGSLSVWLLYGIAVPTYWCAMTYNKVFKKMEETIKNGKMIV